MGKDRAVVVMFPDGQIRWVILYAKGDDDWMVPEGSGDTTESDESRKEWKALWKEEVKRLRVE